MTYRPTLRDILAQACFAVSALGLAQAAVAQEPPRTASAVPLQADKEAPTSSATEPAPLEDTMADAEQALPPPEVGDATLSLLYWQRSGAIGSTTPRPIPGPVANRSYERYLKSFEHPIPEFFNSTVKTKSSN
ncbi:hypothetical protein APR50_34530 [Variovorax paradoxus]|jgi:hypothetical protein|uniref:DUF3613 domain-containing protein n=1 Tax=Variovorax paradoxus TaxID=34073 RepID=UPI0006E54F55|nr:hypothetical protein APR52_39640 [Variovorax paradoxus]KPU98002.1 hypothetical protein APR50_34530 [Variovorax paradoxus]KPV00713.1 hypothetical protein APR49_33190 [Variovorax paradoxus]KPV16300.1 hypothetical protein APR51_31080 [Variovorax paradoxus]KPV27360.1 hypothetical protein APR47_31245 [Variovorax paradoxus]